MRKRSGSRKKNINLLNYLYALMYLKKRKIFCISIQRNGTTSVGDFLSDHGFRVARWSDSVKNGWTGKWHTGDFEAIFKSTQFRCFQAFEDSPWWMPDFYKVINYRFPDAKFIHFYRDADKWFNSMRSHSQGKTIGNTYRHCKIYRRLPEFYYNVDNSSDFRPTENGSDNLLTIDETHREHYKSVYEEYNREIKSYFRKYAPEKLFSSSIEDKRKWQKLGHFLGIKVNDNYERHSNKSR